MPPSVQIVTVFEKYAPIPDQSPRFVDRVAFDAVHDTSFHASRNLQARKDHNVALDLAQHCHQLRLRLPERFLYLRTDLVLDQLLERHGELLKVHVQLWQVINNLKKKKQNEQLLHSLFINVFAFTQKFHSFI